MKWITAKVNMQKNAIMLYSTQSSNHGRLTIISNARKIQKTLTCKKHIIKYAELLLLKGYYVQAALSENRYKTFTGTVPFQKVLIYI